MITIRTAKEEANAIAAKITTSAIFVPFGTTPLSTTDPGNNNCTKNYFTKCKSKFNY